MNGINDILTLKKRPATLLMATFVPFYLAHVVAYSITGTLMERKKYWAVPIYLLILITGLFLLKWCYGMLSGIYLIFLVLSLVQWDPLFIILASAINGLFLMLLFTIAFNSYENAEQKRMLSS